MDPPRTTAKAGTGSLREICRVGAVGGRESIAAGLRARRPQIHPCATPLFFFEHPAGAVGSGWERSKPLSDMLCLLQEFFFVFPKDSPPSCVLLSLLLWQVWKDGCYFEPFDLPGSKLEGIKAAFVDLLVRGREPEASRAFVVRESHAL